MMVYLDDEGIYTPESTVDPTNPYIRKISGTEVRRRLQTGEEIPAWFSAPDVIKLLREVRLDIIYKIFLFLVMLYHNNINCCQSYIYILTLFIGLFFFTFFLL